MKFNELYSIVNKFYNSIIEVKFSGLFERKDRMSNFPIGCCDDACDLLWYYLKNNYNFRIERYNGFYDDGVPENKFNHEWLVVDGFVIDITFKQLNWIIRSCDDIYIGDGAIYNDIFDNIVLKKYYNIRDDERLWNDYNKILVVLNRQ
jgi:hypothetical protein